MSIDQPRDTSHETIAQLADRDADEIDPTHLDSEDLEVALQFAVDRYVQAEEALLAGWQRLDLGQCQEALRQLYAWRICLDQLRKRLDGGLTYHVDSLVLADCYQSLFENPDVETILYLTGMEVGNGAVTINRRIHLDHEAQSSVQAAGDPEASFETLRALDQSGHRLLAHCHNHPGEGRESTHPSEDDREYQDQLEDGGYEALGLIMSQDGYVRLFTNDLDIDVKVHGAGVERVDDGLLYIEEPARDANRRLEPT